MRVRPCALGATQSHSEPFNRFKYPERSSGSLRYQKRVFSIKITCALAVWETNKQNCILINPQVLLMTSPVSNSVWESAADRQNIQRDWFYAYCFQASSIKLYCVCEGRLFSSSREKPTNPSTGVGFPWPTPGQVGGIQEKNRRASFIHSPLYSLPPLALSFPSAFCLLPTHFLFHAFLFFSHSSHCVSSYVPPKKKMRSIPQLILTISRTCILTGWCGLHIILLAVFLENMHLKSRFSVCVCVYI